MALLVGSDGSTFGDLAVPWVAGSPPSDGQWFTLQRTAGLGEPLRSLTVGLIPFAALLRREMLSAQSASRARSRARRRP